MVAAITGLAAILHVSAIAFQVIKWLGVAYLLYLAGQTLRDQSTPPCRSGGSSAPRC
jgi:threonine/homoserine/homoserine lactone efflux protein